MCYQLHNFPGDTHFLWTLSDFIGNSQLKVLNENNLSYFKIQEGYTMEELKRQFRARVREWGKLKYKTISAAEKKLGLKPGTMKNYVEKPNQS